MLEWLFKKKRKKPAGPQPARPAPAAVKAPAPAKPEPVEPLPLGPAHPPDATDEQRRTADEVLQMLAVEEATPPPGAVLAEEVDPNLGRHLLAEGPITREFLHQQLAVSGKADTYLGRVLARLRAPSEAELLHLLAAGYQVADVDLKQCKIPIAVARLVPLEILTKYKMIPIGQIGDLLCVAFAGDVNPKATEAVRRATGLRVKALRCPPHHIQILLRRLMHEQAAKPVASAVVQPLPISDAEYEEGTRGPEERWESIHASQGPIRAVRIA